MTSLRFRADQDLLHARIDVLLDALQDEVSGVIERVTQDVANDARASHSFQNRTEYLQGSIGAVPPVGQLAAGDLRAEVIALMPYASYVEQGTRRNHRTGRPNRPYPFLSPALARRLPSLGSDVSRAVVRAIARAGLGR